MGSKTYHPIHSHVMVRAPSDLKVDRLGDMMGLPPRKK